MQEDSPKILVVDSGQDCMYGTALKNAFVECGYRETVLFSWKNKKIVGSSTMSRVQSRLTVGPEVDEVNHELLLKVKSFQPQLVFLYSCRIVYAKTVRRIKKFGAKVSVYNNDNPFSDYYPKYFWRHYIASLKYADITYIYRENNRILAQKYGAKRVSLLRSYYIGKKNYYTGEERSLNVSRIGFVGHFEADGRESYIKALMDKGITVTLTDAWPKSITEHKNCIVVDRYKESYNEILNELDIAIVFLSKLNQDTYTRRCFEIPATRTMMLSEYTDDLASMYSEGKEIVFFRSIQDFLNKAEYYLDHIDECRDIGQRGYERLLKDGHEAKDRVQQIMEDYCNLMNLNV